MRRFLLWFLWFLLIVTLVLGIASVRLADQASLLLLEVETDRHPEPWPVALRR
jgi:hypothetical protein